MRKIYFFILLFISANLTALATSVNTDVKIHGTNFQIISPPLIEGYLYRDNSTGKVYWLVSGILHHIVDHSTYTRLFSGDPTQYTFNVDNFQAFIAKPIPSVGTIVGTDLTDYAVLGQNSGTVYLRLFGGTGTHYKIPNPQTMNTYHLKWESIVTWPYNPMTFDSENLRIFPSTF